jgi:hypothetical protein
MARTKRGRNGDQRKVALERMFNLKPPRPRETLTAKERTTLNYYRDRLRHALRMGEYYRDVKVGREGEVS